MSKQLLSAAVDAVATEAEWDVLLKAMDEDPSLKDDWSRVWAGRDAHENVALAGGRDFCSGVMAAIANEKPLPSNVVQLPRRTVAAPVRTRASWRTLVPLSAAAGVVAAVIALGGLRGTADEAAAPELSASTASTLETTPVSYNAGETGAALPDEAKAAILNAYLMEHSNSLAERSMGGTLANARFAARTADYRPDAP